MSLAQQINRVVAPFEVISEFQPAGDQPAAIAELTERINATAKRTWCCSAPPVPVRARPRPGSIEQVQRPTLVMVQNKTLAAQLANEFRELLPNNAVEYFVSYYDYYQPEAYVPQTDTFIEKDSSVNEEVERLRHSATNALLTRRDVIVVATVSCIYGLGTPEEYIAGMVTLRKGSEMNRDDLLRKFVAMQYTRNDMDFHRGTFRVRGDTVEIIPMYEELAIRIEFFGDEIENDLHPAPAHRRGDPGRDRDVRLPGLALRRRARSAWAGRSSKIEDELAERLKVLESQNKLVEAQRLRMRTTYDLEMMQQMGFCNGIENYSRHIDGREARHRAALPHRLLPGRLPPGDRRIPRHGPADRRHVRGRHVPQAHARGPRLPAALGDGQPAAEMGRVPRTRRPDRLPLRHSGQVRARQVRRLCPADHPAHRPDRPRGHRQAHEGADR